MSAISIACAIQLMLPGVSLAQAAPAAGESADAPAAANEIEEVTVTGSRIRSNGNDLPTPVTVLATEQLQATTPTSLPDALNKLPAFNSGNSVNSPALANGRGNRAPGNFLDLRGLGPIRNLTLQDGERVLGTFFDGTVDSDMLPQMLIQRVEVVTGGASAVYGSDAVTGVVNFITDNKFNGVKGSFQTGISEYGDSKSVRGGLAGGMDIGANGHLIGSLEYYDRDAIADMGTRPYHDRFSALVGAGTEASPIYLVEDIHYGNMTWGGQPYTGPFLGRRFADDGSLVPLDPGTLTPTANAVIGGDGARQHNQYLTPRVTTEQAFTRYDHEFDNGVRAYISARMAHKFTYAANSHISNTRTNFPLTIFSDNAFLTPAQRAELIATNTPAFLMGRDDEEFTGPGPRSNVIGLTTKTQAGAVNVGLEGKAWGDFTWDVGYSHSQSSTKLVTNNNVNAMRLYAASDAVRDTAGNIVCRVALTAPGAYPGCVPINLFGMFKPSLQAIQWIIGDTSWTADTDMDDVSANITGTAFEGWAGPVQIAVGGEFRRVGLDVRTSVTDPSFHPENLRGGLDGKTFAANNLAWIKEVQSAANGSQDVSEANIEANVPLLKDLPLVQSLTFNGGYRYTHYSNEGNGVSSKFSAKTWKLGLEWQMFDDLKFRATRSRDIRAPTLWDLYQLQTRSSGGFTDPLTKQAGSLNTVSGGNPDLTPEVAHTTTAGVVYTPSWLPNFSVSVDYYDILIRNAVGAVSGNSTTVQALCLASDGSSPYCDLLVRPISYNDSSLANFPILNYSLNQNIAMRSAEGIDVEVNYRTDLADWSGLQGDLRLRALWTYQWDNKNQALAGAIITNAAGTPDQPEHKITLGADYRLDNIGVSVLTRYYTSQHRSADPTRVYAMPDVPAYYQTDLNLSYDFQQAPVTGFLNINNLFDQKGGFVGGSAGVPGQQYGTASYADIIGRYYTVGFRFKF